MTVCKEDKSMGMVSLYHITDKQYCPALLFSLRVISIKFLLVISTLCKTDWS